MLVLSRKPRQSVIINDNLKVTVLGISGNTISLGFKGPRGTTILREELIVQGAGRGAPHDAHEE